MSAIEPKYLLVFQFAWFLLAWAAVTKYFILPNLSKKNRLDALAMMIAPQMFRVLGVGLLVANISPGMPLSFAIPTAIGDTVTAVLAFSAVVALKKRLASAIPLLWITNVFGSLDIVVALIGAIRIGAAEHLNAQWFVPAFVLPLMIVSHVTVFFLLVLRRD